MLRNTRKLCSMLLIICLFLALTACSGGGGSSLPTVSPDGSQPANTASSAPTPAATVENVETDPYAPIEGKKYDIGFLTELEFTNESQMVKYWGEYFDVNFDILPIDGNNYLELLNTRLVSGDIPDVFYFPSSSNLVRYARQGVLAEIPLEAIQKYMPNIYQAMTEEEDMIWSYCKVDGKQMALPGWLSAESIARRPTVYRADWMKNVGVEKEPVTLDEFEDLMYKFALNDPDGNGKKDTYGLSKTGMEVVFGAYGYMRNTRVPTGSLDFWFEKDGQLVYGPIQPEMKEALARLAKWYDDGVIDPEFITGENTGGYWALSHSFIQGRIGFTSMGNFYHWKPPLYEGDHHGQNNKEFENVVGDAANNLLFGTPPTGPNGKMGVSKAHAWDDYFLGFGKQLDDEPDKVGKLLQMMDFTYGTSYENYVTVNNGIQGVDWEFADDQFTPIAISEPWLDREKRQSLGAGFLGWVCPMKFELISMQGRFGWAEDNGMFVGGLESQFVPLLPSQMQYETEVIKLEDEAYISIITGDQPIDYFDEFVARWLSSGGEQLTKEANEWFATLK